MDDAIFYIWLSVVGIKLAYWILIFVRSAFYDYNKAEKSGTLPGVSVVICYKNEKNTIDNTIRDILLQQYPEFEIIAVNDCSTDGSDEIVGNMKDPKLVSITVSADMHGKKLALSEGISHSRYDHILVTDADCRPASVHWIQRMAATLMNEKASVVAGFSPMEPANTFIGRFSAFETLMTALQYMSYALAGIPYMATGRNMMYKKSVFHKYADTLYFSTPAGDDDMLIQNAAVHEKTGLCFHRDAWVYTFPKKDAASFLKQKLRHISVAGRYRPIHQLMLSVFAFSLITCYVGAVLMWLAGWADWQHILFIMIIKWTIQTMIHFRFYRMTDSSFYAFTFPFWELCLATYYITLGVFSLFRRPVSWK
jgi:glycosyltransferase involved in cell wall biosynthesis